MLGALFGFRGRLSRAGFWETVASILLIDVLIVLGAMYVADSGPPGWEALLQAAPWAVAILTVWGSLATSIKRLHDRGRPGWLILVALIPVLGWLWLLVDLFLLEGDEGRNRYGRPPHAPAGSAASPSRFDWGSQPTAPAAFAAAPAASAFDWHEPAPMDHHEAPAAAEVHEDPAPEAPAEAQGMHDDHPEAHDQPDPVHAAEEPIRPEPEAHPIEPEAHAAPPADPVLDLIHDPAPAPARQAVPEDDEPLRILTH
ncbi:MAG TPA: DUF805 domain-containing protein [Caulobacteraceae bacterium]|nr:DUF805 domain-containing protein [Caulobacteraceae bacterium]